MLADFSVEIVDEALSCVVKDWTHHVDGSSNLQGNGAGVILESPDDVRVELSVKFEVHSS